MPKKQEHPFRPFLPKDARALIIGNAPAYHLCSADPRDLKEGEFAFYYGSINDFFWYALKAVFDPSEPRWSRTRRHCEAFLRDHSLAMADVLKSFTRKGKSSSQSTLSALHFNPAVFDYLSLRSHKIRYLYFMGQYTLELFMKGIKEQKIVYHIEAGERTHKSFNLTLQKGKRPKSYRCHILQTASLRINRNLDDIITEYKESFADMFESGL